MPQAEVRQTCLLSTEAVVLESRLPPADVLHDVVGSFVDAVEQLLNFQNTAYSFLGLPVLISLLEMELVPLEHVCVAGLEKPCEFSGYRHGPYAIALALVHNGGSPMQLHNIHQQDRLHLRCKGGEGDPELLHYLAHKLTIVPSTLLADQSKVTWAPLLQCGQISH